MVRKDLNHPSVILYTIGNEIPDEGNLAGVRLGHELADKVRSLDDSRYVTKAVTGFLVADMADFAELRESASAIAASGVNGAATRDLPMS